MDATAGVSYVQRFGNVVQRARLGAILWQAPADEAALRELGTLQRPDGSFSYWLPQVGNVCDTAYILQWFNDLAVHRGPVVESACRFLLDGQQTDGGWDEVEEVRAFDPPEWMVPGRIETRVWLTAFCAHVLIRFGYAEAPGTRCPTDFLLAHSDKGGRLAGYDRATWLALPMLAFWPGPESAAFRRAAAAADAGYCPDREGSYLAWMLRCLRDAGLALSHPLVTRALADLERRQRGDGSWDAEEGEEHVASATVEALRAFKACGRIGRLPWGESG